MDPTNCFKEHSVGKLEAINKYNREELVKGNNYDE
jgi:hypothetical protein